MDAAAKPASKYTKEEVYNLVVLLSVSVGLTVATGACAYYTSDSSSVLQFLGLQPFPSIIAIFTGMIANIVFGIIDNGGLFFGMKALEPFMPSGELTRAGLGNTYSDTLGAFLGTFVGVIIRNWTRIDDTPLWANAVGITVGCLIGLYVPRYLTGMR